MQQIQAVSPNFSFKRPITVTSVPARLLHDAYNQLGENGGTPKTRKTKVYHGSMIRARKEAGIHRKSPRPVTSITGNAQLLEASLNPSTSI